MKLFRTKLKSLDRSNVVNEFLPEGTKIGDEVIFKNTYGKSGIWKVIEVDPERSMVINGSEIINNE